MVTIDAAFSLGVEDKIGSKRRASMPTSLLGVASVGADQDAVAAAVARAKRAALRNWQNLGRKLWRPRHSLPLMACNQERCGFRIDEL
jgi:hypothetical protein